MLTLLAPAALVGLSLLAIPIIIHLLKPRKVRRTPFSSLRWLHVTQQRLAWRIRWHQVLLFLLRTAFIVLLILAVAKPILNRDASTGPTERFVVLDVSRSMLYRHGEKPTPFETGKQIAATLLTSGGGGDRTALLATGATTQVLGPLVPDGERHMPALTALEAGLTETDFGSALDKIQSQLSQRRDNAEVKLYFITDNHQGAWQQGAIATLLKELPAKVRTVIIDVADPAAQNGWIASCRAEEELSDERRTLSVQLRSVGPAQERTLRLTGLTGLGDRSQKVMLEPGRPTEVRFELPLDYQARGQTAAITLEPPDSLPSDDEWTMALDLGAACRVLLVEGSSQPGDPVGPGFALRTAIESLSASGQSIRLTSKKYTDVQPEDFRDVDAVLWADVPQMSEASLHALEERVQQGLGLAVFLGPGVEQTFYNSRLFKPLQRASGLMPVSLERVEEIPMSQGGLVPLANIAWHHPLFTGLFDPSLGDLAQSQVHAFYRFASPPAETDGILATVAGTPAVVEHSVGTGKVVLFNTTANDAWGDLPRRKSFVPLVDRLINDLSGGVMLRTFQVGEAVKLLAAPTSNDETISVISPSGRVLQPNATPVGHRTLLRLPGLSEPGAYQVQRSSEPQPDFSFVVQPGRGDSLLVETSQDLLHDWWQPAEFEVVRGEVAAERFGAVASQAMITAWLVLAAAVVMGLELFLANWFCPRVSPTLASSVIQHRQPAVAPSSAELKVT